jgi:CheY-like chemotaxis protein
MKLMVVDDDPHLTEMLTQFLGGQGYEVCRASGVKEAIRMIPKEKPRIVLLDLMLGDGLGTSVERFIRQNRELHREIGIIYETCVSEPEEKTLMLKHRADYVLNKPYKPDELIDTINSLKVSMKDERTVSKETGLLPVIAFERETDYHLLRNDDFEIKMMSILDRAELLRFEPDSLKEKHGALAGGIKAAIDLGRLRGTFAYDLGPGMFGILSVASDLQLFKSGFEIMCAGVSKKRELDFEKECCIVDRTFSKDVRTQIGVQQILRGLNAKLQKVEAARREEIGSYAIRNPNGRYSEWAG